MPEIEEAGPTDFALHCTDGERSVRRTAAEMQALQVDLKSKITEQFAGESMSPEVLRELGAEAEARL